MRVLVSDFDGTITRRDFYSCVVEMGLTPDGLAPWHLYTAGEISHFEALRRIFASVRADEKTLDAVLTSMRPERVVQSLREGLRRLGRTDGLGGADRSRHGGQTAPAEAGASDDGQSEGRAASGAGKNRLC